ncbi:MAG: hypothetical protein K0U16_07355 [Gammaproteobacteria bacterium]|nr:hypothetical protein [Gammaproteobacteria bacterium]
MTVSIWSVVALSVMCIGTNLVWYLLFRRALENNEEAIRLLRDRTRPGDDTIRLVDLLARENRQLRHGSSLAEDEPA